MVPPPSKSSATKGQEVNSLDLKTLLFGKEEEKWTIMERKIVSSNMGDVLLGEVFGGFWENVVEV